MKKNITVKANPDKLQQIYRALDIEERPFDAKVSTGVNGLRTISVIVDEQDYEYFKNILQ